MFKILLVMALSSSALAEDLKTRLTVQSQIGEEFVVETTVSGVDTNKQLLVTLHVEEVIYKITGQYKKEAFLNNRDLAIRRLEKRLNNHGLKFDGIGILVFKMKSGKIVDVE